MWLFCRNCKQEHDTLIDCSRARRLAEYAAEQAKMVGTAAPAHKIKTILGHPSEPVLEQNRAKQGKTVITGNKPSTQTEAPSITGNTSRQAAFKLAKAAIGLSRLEIWAHPDKHQKIKDFASAL